MADLNLLNVTLNKILEVIHPEGHKACTDLQKAICKAEPYSKAFHGIDTLLWEGRSLIYNWTTPLNWDKWNALEAWTPIVTLGKYPGGDSHWSEASSWARIHQFYRWKHSHGQRKACRE